MSNSRINEIVDSIRKIDNVIITKPFELGSDEIISGNVDFEINQDTRLSFEVKIYPQYPLRSHDAETINFINRDLIEFDHVMGDGTICIHTYHNPSLTKKLFIDFNSLKNWAEKYFLKKETDSHYEHIIVPSKIFLGLQRVFLFSEIEYALKKGDYGEIDYSNLSTGIFHTDSISTSLVQNFKIGNQTYSCSWNSQLKSLIKEGSRFGLFYFAEEVPAINKRFAVINWRELKPFLSQAFLNKLHSVEKEYSQKQLGTIMPLLIGYKTTSDEFHWQAIMLQVGKFPIHGVKGDGNYYTEVNEKEIDWVLTRNCSYKYFFGRGKLNNNITNKKILIIGIGAIGSIVATTLTRSGCTQIDLIDYDVKEPENVCRSEYHFLSGLNNKTNDLATHLNEISPFIEVKLLNYKFSEYFNFYLKSFYGNEKGKKSIENYLDSYDLVFDCSTDNDLMYVLSTLELQTTIINFSITNHASEFVCGVTPNFYQFVTEQFENRLGDDLIDVYAPTGCWSPTFKASYNDINVLVQYAIKHINSLYNNKLPIRNFILKTSFEDGFKLKLEQY